jgi:hypothetical protein
VATSEAKIAYVRRAKESLRADLRAKTWEEKVRAIERMNEMSRVAKEAMRRALTKEAAGASGHSR